MTQLIIIDANTPKDAPMINARLAIAQPAFPIPLSLPDGAVAHRLGDGMFAIDQRDDSTGEVHRVIVAEENREALLAWEGAAGVVGLMLEDLRAAYVGYDLWALDQLDHTAGDWQCVVVTRGDLEALDSLRSRGALSSLILGDDRSSGAYLAHFMDREGVVEITIQDAPLSLVLVKHNTPVGL